MPPPFPIVIDAAADIIPTLSMILNRISGIKHQSEHGFSTCEFTAWDGAAEVTVRVRTSIAQRMFGSQVVAASLMLLRGDTLDTSLNAHGNVADWFDGGKYEEFSLSIEDGHIFFDDVFYRYQLRSPGFLQSEICVMDDHRSVLTMHHVSDKYPELILHCSLDGAARKKLLLSAVLIDLSRMACSSYST